MVSVASCKTKRVNVERDIWTEPNADFIPVLFRDHFLCFKAMIIRRAESHYTLQNWATSRTANSCVRRMRSIPCA